MNIKPLSDFASFVSEKIDSSEITINNYVTTDNLLQNKQGVEVAVSLPISNVKLIKYEKGDTLISNIRPYLKKIWHADKSGGCSNDVLVFRAKDYVDSTYLYYSLLQDSFFEYVMSGVKGTKMPRGDKSQMVNFLLTMPSIPIQQKIANILSTLDRKIALNQQINQKLEAMAKQLYDYWFVQFDFPDENGKPYKSSGGEMVWCEALKREVPKGSELKTLDQISNITMGQSPRGESYNENGCGIVFFQGSTDFNWRFPSIRQYTTEPSRIAKSGDILLSVRAPVGAMNITKVDCCIGRGLAALHSKDNFNSFLFYVMKYFEKSFSLRNSVGTTFGSITKDDLYSLILIYPEKSKLEEYEDIVSKYNDIILNKTNEIEKLTQLRDFLLPMLMNGQVSVK